MVYSKKIKTYISSILLIHLLFGTINGSVFAYTSGNLDPNGSSYGYTLSDSHEETGPVYDWREINTIGTPLSLSGNTAIIPFGFNFPFFDTVQTSFKFHSNGWFLLDSKANYSDYNYLFSCFQTNLLTNDTENIYYYSDPITQEFIIEFNNAHETGWENLGYTFQAILNKFGEIRCNYKNMPEGSVGGQLFWTSYSSELFYNNSITNNSSILFTRNPHIVTSYLQTEATGSLRSPLSIEASGSTIAEDPLAYSWDISSKPSGSQVTIDSLSGKTTQAITFSPDKPGDYTLSFTTTNVKEGHTNEQSTKSITVHAYGVAFYTDSRYSTALTNMNFSWPLYVSLSDPGFMYASGNINATLKTTISQDEETFSFEKVENEYRFGPIQIATGSLAHTGNTILELGTNDGINVSFSSPKKIKSDFSHMENNQWGYFAWEKSILTSDADISNDPSLESLSGSYTHDDQIYTSIASDDSDYRVTHPDVWYGVDWYGWNQQVYTLPLSGTLGENDTVEISWKWYNTKGECSNGAPMSYKKNDSIFSQIVQYLNPISTTYAACEDLDINDIYMEVFNTQTQKWDIADSILGYNGAESDFILHKTYSKTDILPYLSGSTITYRTREYEYTKREMPQSSLHTNYTYIAQNTTSTIASSIGNTTPTPSSPINGSCGSSNGTTTSVAPSSNLCTTGSASSVTSGATWTWSCNGSDGGTNSSCQATKPVSNNSGGGWGGGWGGSIAKDSCPLGDFSPSYYDGKCGDAPKKIVWAKEIIVNDLFFTGTINKTITGSLAVKNESGATLSYKTHILSMSGTLKSNTGGIFQYKPGKTNIKEYSFLYQATDGEIWSNTWVVHIAFIETNVGSGPVKIAATSTPSGSIQNTQPVLTDPFIYNACKYNDRDFKSIYFEDISTNKEKENIEILLRNCIINGRTEKEFEPWDYTTRAEFTKAVLRSLGESYDFEGKNTSFKDIPLLDWKTGIMEKALGLRLIRGIQLWEGLYFEPNRFIKKREALTILMKWLKRNDAIFLNEEHSIDEYIQEARRYGVVINMDSDESLTREEMAKLIVWSFRQNYIFGNK